jgi:tetratricopeptide (TPR) repeat protein
MNISTRQLVVRLALGSVAALGVWAVAPPCACAQEQEVDVEALRALIADGTKFAAEGKYDEAIAKFFEAKTVYDDPRFDFNIARCYHKKGSCEPATQYYRALLARADADPEDRKDAERFLAELGPCKVEVAQDPKKGDPEQGKPKGGGAGAYDYVAWGLLIGGGLTLGGGVVLDVGSAARGDDLEAAAASGDSARYDAAKQEVEDRQVVLYGMYGVGAALTLGGSLMLLLDGDVESAEGGALRWGPLLAPGVAGASVSGRF